MASRSLAAALAALSAAARRYESAGPRPGTAGLFRVTIVDDSAENAKGVDRLFDAFGATIDALPGILTDTVPAIRAEHRRNFSTEGANGRGKWAPLAPRTLAERRRLGFGPGPILTRTGALRDHVLAAAAEVTATGTTVTLRIEPDADVGGVRKYRALAKGYENIPARPMVTVGPAGAKRITSTLQRAFRARAAANGLR